MPNLPDHDELLAEITLTNELIWDRRLDRSKVTDWLANFRGEVFNTEYEHSLALWLLTNFVLYTEREVNHLCKVMFRDYLHKQLRGRPGSVDQALNEVHARTMYASLGRPSESGAMLMYLFRTANSLGIRDIQPSSRTDFDNIVFVDDVALSIDHHSQAWSYLQNHMSHFPGKTVHLLTMVASENAIGFLAGMGVEVTSAITLTNESKAFETDSYVFHLNAEHRTPAKRLAHHYGMKCFPSHPLGYSNGQYLFGFYYNVPDNTLPIIWSSENHWTPVLRRSHKNYGRTGSRDLGFFL